MPNENGIPRNRRGTLTIIEEGKKNDRMFLSNNRGHAPFFSVFEIRSNITDDGASCGLELIPKDISHINTFNKFNAHYEIVPFSRGAQW